MTTTRELAIPIPHEEIAAFCRKWGIKRLSFFGSIVDFKSSRRSGSWRRYSAARSIFVSP
jgi:hypothetical protein